MIDRPSQSLERVLRNACEEVAERARSGSLQPAQDVLDTYVELASDEESAIEVIYSEFVAFDEVGKRPPLDAWLARYSAHRMRLERLIQLHDILAETQDRENERPLKDFGPYELLSEIGKGSNGVVYRARQKSLSRIVALKILRSHDAGPSEIDRFQKEAAAVASLQHPNIVQIYEIGHHEGHEYLSMEYVEGGSVESRVKFGEWSNHDIAAFIRSVSDSIQHAHQQGIVHLDLKPANILQTKSGVIKIADFGFAKRTLAIGDEFTRDAELVGTIAYMSPEQAKGSTKETAAASDIFSIGVILFELLTNRLPFGSGASTEVLQRIIHDEVPPPSKFRKHVSKDLDTICLKCLAKLPQDRYPSARHLSEDLARFLDHRPILARPIPIWERMARMAFRKPIRTASAVFVFAGVLLAFLILLEQHRHVQNLREQTARQEIEATQERLRAANAEDAFQSSLNRTRELVDRWAQIGMNVRDEPGMDEMKRRAFEDAALYYEEFLTQNLEDPAIRLEAARASMRSAVIQNELGMWSQAEKGLRQAIEWLSQCEENASTLSERAECLAQLGHVLRKLEKWNDSEATYCSAIQILEGLDSSEPNNPRLLMRIANAEVNLCVLLRREQRWDECLHRYDHAIHLQRMAIYLRLNRPIPLSESSSDESIHRKRFFKLTSECNRLQRLLAEENEQTQLLLARESYLGELALSVDDLGLVLVKKGWEALAEGCFRNAIALRSLTLKMNPKNRRIEYYLARGQTHLANLMMAKGDTDSAKQLLQESNESFVELLQDFPDRHDYKNEWGNCLIRLARCCEDDKQYKDAIDFASRGVAIQEELLVELPDIEYLRNNLTNGLTVLALCLRRAGDTIQSDHQYERALRVSPANPFPMNHWAWTLAVPKDCSPEDAQKGLDLARKAVALAPNNGNFLNTLAVCLYRNGNLSEALQTIERSIAVNDHSRIYDWYLKSMILVRTGNRQEAESLYRTAEEKRVEYRVHDLELQRIANEAADLLAHPLAN